MRNRFQLNEQEKGRIRALHGIQVISEASTLENLGKSMADNPKQWNELPKDWKELFTLLGYIEKTYNDWINDVDFDNVLDFIEEWEQTMDAWTEEEKARAQKILKTIDRSFLINKVDINEQTDYSDEEGVTLTIDKEFDYDGPTSRKDIVRNLWQIQSLLQDCSPAITLTRVVGMLENLGETVTRLDRNLENCNCEGSGSEPVASIDV
tara:strand:+ start:167 stop:790 length:624 start_codon:yes stop_codon:yes gene_type:complete